MATGKYPFVMCNFAPPDMVGHTGVYEAALVACAATGKPLPPPPWHVTCHVTCLDCAIGEVEKGCEEHGYVMLVTADHGNAERMIDEAGKPVTKHTTFRGTPFVHMRVCVCVFV